MALVAALVLLASLVSAQVRQSDRAAFNDNRTPSGTLSAGVLTVHLVARETEWHPDGESSPGVIVRAFGVEGGPSLVPGPLLRVPQGTEVRALVHNMLMGHRLVVHGLNTRGSRESDTASLAAGETREFRFVASRAGTYYYWAATNSAALNRRDGIDTQLAGALVVDQPNVAVSRDRIFVITSWGGQVGRDSVNAGRIVINGASWPNTERLAYDVGDSVRMRVINAGAGPHPMHLHGFYYNVDSRGTEQADSIYASSSSAHLVNTERLTTGRTFSLTWVPERPGNWLFHCHDPAHIAAHRHELDGRDAPREMDMHGDQMLGMMSGPVLGILVRDVPGRRAAQEPAAQRRLRLVVRQVDSGGPQDEPAFAYTIDDAGTQPPTIVLERGVPVSITVVNHLPEATSVHWHGIELGSYYDGVAGFAGHAGHIAPEIAPNDSFVARFTPPRSGTFMYHPHVGETRQQKAGLGGALIVVDALQAYDSATDVAVLVTTPRRIADDSVVLLNGTATPAAREWHVGATYRLRLMNLHNNRPAMIMRLVRDSTVLMWTPIAKDGMNVPADQVAVRAAAQQMGNGETYDFAFTPTMTGDMRFEVTSGQGQLLVRMPIHVSGAQR